MNKVKIQNPHSYDVKISIGDSPSRTPSSTFTVRAGRTEEKSLHSGKWLFYDRVRSNREMTALGEVTHNKQMFVVPPCREW